jgi:tripartite-type tricarboxylate transporter receptor subunit TctC
VTVVKIIFITFYIALPYCVPAIAQENFFSGKTIRIVVGSSPGGGYDYWARLFARHMSKYIRGNPEVIVQNMPGAGSLAATNYIYSVAKADGLTLGMPNQGVYMGQIVGDKEARFDIQNSTGLVRQIGIQRFCICAPTHPINLWTT